MEYAPPIFSFICLQFNTDIFENSLLDIMSYSLHI